MDNATIRAWALANGMDVPKNGNVPPQIAIAYAMDQAKSEKAEKPKSEKPKKEKVEKKIKEIPAGDLVTEFSEIFSAGTIKMVVSQHPDRAREILTTGKAFLANGMRSRYAAIGKAIKGETPRIKGENAPEKPATGKGKGKAATIANVAPTGESAAIVGYAVILPTGATVLVNTEAEAEAIRKVVSGAIVAPRI